MWDMFGCEGGLGLGAFPTTSQFTGASVCRETPQSSPHCLHSLPACAGVKIIFRVGLVLLKQALGSEKVRGCQGQYLRPWSGCGASAPRSCRRPSLGQEVWPPCPSPRREEGAEEPLVGASWPCAQQPWTVRRDFVFCLNKKERAQRPRST